MKRRSKKASRRWPVLAGLGAVGIGFIILGWATAGREFLPSVLLEVGGGMLLFSVLFALERHVLDRIDEVREETVEVSRRVEEVAAESANTRAALARLSTMTENAMRRRSEEIDEIFDAFENDVSVENTHRLLQLATDLRAIASEGVRVAIPNSWLRVRFKAAETAEHKVVLLRIEDLAGNELGTVTWVGDQGPEEIAVSLATELQRHGEFSPDFNAQPLFENLLSTVRTPVFARTRGNMVRPT